MSQNIQSPIIKKPTVLKPQKVSTDNQGFRKFTQTPPPVLNMTNNNLKFLNPRLANIIHPQDGLVSLNDQLMQLTLLTPTVVQQKSNSIGSPLRNLNSPQTKVVQPLTIVQERKQPQQEFNFRQEQPQVSLSEVENLNRVGIESSKQIQDNYERGNLEIKNQIFKQEVQRNGPENIVELALDKYMHYVLEKILDQGPLGHKQWIYEAILSQKEVLWGEKFAQKIFAKCIETSKINSRDHYLQFVDFILKNKDISKNMRYNAQGNQILQKAVEVFEDEHLTVLLNDLSQTIVPDDLSDNKNLNNKAKSELFVQELCTNQFGCLIVNKIIESQLLRGGKPKQIMVKIIDRIVAKSVDLSLKQYSNYVVQQVLLKGSKDQQLELINQQLIPNFYSLAQNKYGSNVAEKVVESATSAQLDILFNSQIKHNLEVLVNDSYANYVMQKFYKCAQPHKQLRISFCEAVVDLEKSKRLSQNGQIVLRFINQNGRTDGHQQQNGHQTHNQQHYYPNQSRTNQNIYTQQMQMPMPYNYANYQQFYTAQQQQYYQQFYANQQQYPQMPQQFYQQQQQMFQSGPQFSRQR